MERISVVGNSGSGKTTIGRRIAAELDAPMIELDALYHLEGWRPRPRHELRTILRPLLDQPRWVVDGNYRELVQDLVWSSADTVVWMDLPRRVVMPAITVRTLKRIVLREELWNGNREHPSGLVKREPTDNILLWAWTRHLPVRERYTRAMADPRWSRLDFHRISTRRAAAELVASIRRNA